MEDKFPSFFQCKLEINFSLNFSNLLDSFGLRKKIIAFVKDEGVFLNAVTSTLRYVVSYDILGLEESFNGSRFGHVFSKACQYGIVEEKNYKDMKFVSIKNAQSNIQVCITWLKRFGNDKQSGTRHV